MIYWGVISTIYKKVFDMNLCWYLTVDWPGRYLNYYADTFIRFTEYGTKWDDFNLSGGMTWNLMNSFHSNFRVQSNSLTRDIFQRFVGAYLNLHGKMSGWSFGKLKAKSSENHWLLLNFNIHTDNMST